MDEEIKTAEEVIMLATADMDIEGEVEMPDEERERVLLAGETGPDPDPHTPKTPKTPKTPSYIPSCNTNSKNN